MLYDTYKVYYTLFIVFAVDLSCVMPLSAHEDDRITPVMAQFMQQLNSQMEGSGVNVIQKQGSEMDLSIGSPLILPCIAASSVDSDVKAAVSKAEIGRSEQ